MNVARILSTGSKTFLQLHQNGVLLTRSAQHNRPNCKLTPVTCRETWVLVPSCMETCQPRSSIALVPSAEIIIPASSHEFAQQRLRGNYVSWQGDEMFQRLQQSAHFRELFLCWLPH